MKGKLSVKAYINSNLKNKDTVNSLYIRVVYNKKTTSIPFIKLIFGNTIDISTKIDSNSNLTAIESIALYNLTNVMNFLSTVNKDDISILSDVVDKLNKKVSDISRYLIYQIVEIDILDTTGNSSIENLASMGKIFIFRAFFVSFIGYDLSLYDYLFHNSSLIKERLEQVETNLQFMQNVFSDFLTIPEQAIEDDIKLFRKEAIKYLTN